MRRRIFVFTLVAFVATASSQVNAATGDRPTADITGTFVAGTTPVRIVADQSELQNLATQAFNAHGAFRVESGAAQTLRFSVTGPASVQVAVSSGSGAASFTQNATGSSLRNALLRAADAAVQHITKKPGFFAGRLAFIREQGGASEVCTADLFFTDFSQLTKDRSQSVMPRWSPDGRRILYTGYFRNGYPDIYVIDTTTNQRAVFVSMKGTNNGARFSPDGQRVAMILSGAGNPEVYLANAQGRVTTRLTKTDRQIEATPSWSRDGSRLVVASDAVATGKPQLYLLGTTAGATLQRLPTNISGYCAEPDWSHGNPDLIAFTAASGSGYEVAVYNLRTKADAVVVTSGAGDAIEPFWLPDGRHLLYTARAAGTSRICIVDTESKRSTTLSPTSLGKAYQASFSAR